MHAKRHTVGVHCAAVVILHMVPMGALAGPSDHTHTASVGAVVTSSAASTELTPEEERALLEAALGEDAAAQSDEPAPSAQNTNPIVSAVLGAFQSANPDIALILDVAASVFSAEPMQLGAHDPNRTGFTLQQLEMSLGASVDPYFRFDANIVFAQFGVEVEEAYASSLALPWNLQLRAGQFLTRMGRINQSHPHSWHFTDQPLVNGKFLGGEGSRGLGAEVSWLTPLPWYAQVSASATDAAGACCARSFFGANDLGVSNVDDLLYTVRLEQFFPIDEDLSVYWGLTTQLGPNGSGNGNRTDIYATDLYVRYRPAASVVRASLSLQMEGMFRSRELPGLEPLQDVGFYAQLVYIFALRWETGARHEYVSGVAGDPLDPDWNSGRHRTSLQLTFYPSHFSRIRLQGNHDAPTYRPGSIWSAMLALEVLVGAHGAHKF